VRVNALFNRLLGFSGTVVEDVTFSGGALLVQVRLSSRLLVCPCGRTSRAGYDSSRRRWRHLDFGRWKVYIVADIRRLDCAGCGQVRTEWMPFARPGARHTRDFEDLAGWLTKRMSKSAVATLLGTTWSTVHGIVGRLVDTHLDTDRLDALVRIGVDEIAYRKGRKFLTVVTDHDTGRVVWLADGHDQAVLRTFFDQLGPHRCARIEAITMDMTPVWRAPATQYLPNAAICFDAFHVIKWAGDAVELAYHGTARPSWHLPGLSPAKTWQQVRGVLRTPTERLDRAGHTILANLRRHQPHLHRAWQLKEQLRELYRTVEPADAHSYLTRWTNSAQRAASNAMKLLAGRIHRHHDGIINAVTHGLSNSLTEGLNAGIRLIQRRAHGYANLDNLIEMIYLCHSGVPTPLPTHRN
jgi:transposase